jgi:hypothetical protein
LPARYVDPETARGNLPEGQHLFRSSDGFSDTVVERGIPFSRVYDASEELWRIRRQIYPRPAGSPGRPRASVAFNTHRSLRRG